MINGTPSTEADREAAEDIRNRPVSPAYPDVGSAALDRWVDDHRRTERFDKAITELENAVGSPEAEGVRCTTVSVYDRDP